MKSEGWNNIIKEILIPVEESWHSTYYEVDSCIRGCYTGCETHEELAQRLREIAEMLSDAADEIENTEDPEEEDYGYDEDN